MYLLSCMLNDALRLERPKIQKMYDFQMAYTHKIFNNFY